MGQQFDYRQIYTTLLQDWLGADDSVLAASKFDGFKNQKIPIIDSNKIVDPSCYLPSFELPVELSYFQVELVDNLWVDIRWQTETETDNEFFRVERSADGITFETISEIPGIGNSSAPTVYGIDDQEPLSGLSYYRLKQVDIDGKHSYSDIKSINVKRQVVKGVKVYPNPVKYDFYLVLTSKEDLKITMNIVNSNGIRVYSETLNLSIGFNKFNFETKNLIAGNYFLQLFGENIEESLSIIVSK